MEAREFGFGQIVSECASLAREKLALSALVVLGIAVVYTVLDLLGNNSANTIPTLLISVSGQFYFTEKLLPDRIPSGQRKRRFGSLFGASFLAGIAALAGSLFLLLPGIYLLARWELTTPFVVFEDMRATEAMRKSWKATADSWLPIAGVLVLTGVVVIAAFIAMIAVVQVLHVPGDSPLLSIPLNIVTGLFNVANWIVAAAIYRLAVPTYAGTAEVFA